MKSSLGKWALVFFVFGVGYMVGGDTERWREKEYSMCQSVRIAWAAIEDDYEASRRYAEFKMKSTGESFYKMTRSEEEQAYVDSVSEMLDICEYE